MNDKRAHAEQVPERYLAEVSKDSDNFMEQLLAQSFSAGELKRGDLRKGVVVSIAPHEILVDIGTKSEGVITSREMERIESDVLNSLKVGDEIMAFVVNPEDRDGNIVLSLSRAQMEQDWQYVQKLHESGESFAETVNGFNKGGLIVKIGRIRGFVPASQLSDHHWREGELEGDNENRLTSLVGQTLQLKIIELDRQRNRLILSERAAMSELRKEQKERLLQELKEGDTCQGEVSSLCDFGAFIDLGGADGLVHLSELSWGRVNHPSEVLKVGDKVSVYVLSVDREKRRIGLSLKRLQSEPWSRIEEFCAVGQLVEGRITKLTNFGAFACINGGIEGLIHISELSDKRINHPKEVVREGDVLTLRVIRIDAEKRRMGLSLKQVADYVALDWQEELTEGAAEKPLSEE
jgi:small subunit ribosomal protein S1